jgi:hypothetical protein
MVLQSSSAIVMETAGEITLSRKHKKYFPHLLLFPGAKSSTLGVALHYRAQLTGLHAGSSQKYG